MFATRTAKLFIDDSKIVLMEEIDIRDTEIRMCSKNFTRISRVLLHQYLKLAGQFGTIIEVDTTDFVEADFQKLLREVKKARNS